MSELYFDRSVVRSPGKDFEKSLVKRRGIPNLIKGKLLKSFS